MTRPNKILVAFDGSPHSKQALEWAIDLSRNSNGSVVAVYVFEPVNIMSIYDAQGGSDITMREAMKELKEKGMEDVLVVGGGVIPDADIPALKEAGVAEVFTPGTPTSAIVDFINTNVK